MTLVKKNIAPAVPQKRFLRLSGYIGFFLPIIIVLGTLAASECSIILPSISAYYHSVMGDVFVGCLSAMTFCFVVYNGYGWLDNAVTNVAGIALLGVAFYPTKIADASQLDCQLFTESTNQLISNIHYASAAIFFTMLAFMCIFQFTKGDPTKRMKMIRNRIYYTCGFLIIICMISIGIYAFKYASVDSTFVFWAEVVALWSFSAAWLIKSEMTLTDK